MDRERTGYRLPRTIEELSCAQVKHYQDSEADVIVTLKLLRKTKILFEHYFSIKDVNQAYFLEELENIFEGQTNTNVFDLLTTKIPEWGNKTGFAVLEDIVSKEKLIATEEDKEFNKKKAESLKVTDREPKKGGRKKKSMEGEVLDNKNGKKEDGFVLPGNIPEIVAVVDGKFVDFLSRERIGNVKRFEEARNEIKVLINQIPQECLGENLNTLSENTATFLREFFTRAGVGYEKSQKYADFCTYLRSLNHPNHRENDTF
ncbi:MAG TPA: hypothetical protein VF185_04865 [Patescibacteria group bacterium]